MRLAFQRQSSSRRYGERDVSRKQAVPKEITWGRVDGECAHMRKRFRGGIPGGSTHAGRYGIRTDDMDDDDFWSATCGDLTGIVKNRESTNSSRGFSSEMESGHGPFYDLSRLIQLT